MSSLMSPVGPEEPEVYWKRRAVFAGAVVVVLLVLWVLLKPSGSAPESSPVATPSASASPTASPSDSTSASPSASASVKPKVVDCADGDILVTVQTDKSSYPEGENPVITMSIVNASDNVCRRDIGSASNEISITSGGVAVFSSDTCADPGKVDRTKLKPGETADVRVTWNRKLTTAGCEDRPSASSGTYVVVGRNGAVESTGATFVLE